MKAYSNGREIRFDPARNTAAKDDEAIVRRETNRGPASLQNKSIRRIVAFISIIIIRMQVKDIQFKSMLRD
jgi:hypothetical protein